MFFFVCFFFSLVILRGRFIFPSELVGYGTGTGDFQHCNFVRHPVNQFSISSMMLLCLAVVRCSYLIILSVRGS